LLGWFLGSVAGGGFGGDRNRCAHVGGPDALEEFLPVEVWWGVDYGEDDEVEDLSGIEGFELQWFVVLEGGEGLGDDVGEGREEG